ncbi:hypothetical protein HK101_003012 [Irineochytrium annulatum]|nr:hypothetical protein HK101_003012 [Irineochytrium annulatum]
MHADYILVAEFDIDKGSSLTHQFPKETGTDPHVLAELMLPDGAHLREEDWTMFFLNQKQGDGIPVVQRQRKVGQDESAKTVDASGYAYAPGKGWRTLSTKPRVSIRLEDTQVTVWNGLGTEKLSEISVLSNAEYRQLEPLCVCVFCDESILCQYELLISTKNVILTPASIAFRFANNDDEILFLNHLDTALFLHRKYTHNLGPLLLLAMERFFESESDEILYSLFNSLNSMDISLMPRLTLIERNILRASEDKGMFEEKFQEMEERDYYRRHGGGGGGGGEHHSGTNSVNKDRHFYETRIEFEGVRVPIRVPLAVFPEEIGDFSIIQLATTFSALNAIHPPPGGPGAVQWKNGSPYLWHPHLDSGPSTHPIVLLLNALLTQKRVVFLGHQRAAGEVANYVLAACAAASGGGALLRGFAERCFPYVSLASLETLLAVPGFIAGVTNPVFEEQTAWWDVLCNINTGKIIVSSRIEAVDAGVVSESKDYSKDKSRDWMKSGSWQGDDEFVGEVVYAIQSHMGELYVRQKFYDYVRRFIDVTAAFELESVGTTGIGLTPINTGNADLGIGAYFTDEASRRKEMLMLRNRMEGWRAARSYLLFQKDFQTYLRRRPIRDMDLRHAASRLRAAASLEESTVVRVFLALHDNLVGVGTDAALVELLSYMPQNLGGLMPIAIGLFHARWEVRRASTRILWRLDWHRVGTRFNQHLNPFFRLCYSRSSRELLAAAEQEAYLDDPDFEENEAAVEVKVVEAPVVSASDGTGGGRDRREMARDEARRKSKRNTSRMSTMFEAKNASRLIFNTNGGMSNPPMPGIPGGLNALRKSPTPTPPAWMTESADLNVNEIGGNNGNSAGNSYSSVGGGGAYGGGGGGAYGGGGSGAYRGGSRGKPQPQVPTTAPTTTSSQKSSSPRLDTITRSATLTKLDSFMAELEAFGADSPSPSAAGPSEVVSPRSPRSPKIDSLSRGYRPAPQMRQPTSLPRPPGQQDDLKTRLQQQHQSYFPEDAAAIMEQHQYQSGSGASSPPLSTGQMSPRTYGSTSRDGGGGSPVGSPKASSGYSSYQGGVRGTSLKNPLQQQMQQQSQQGQQTSPTGRPQQQQSPPTSRAPLQAKSLPQPQAGVKASPSASTPASTSPSPRTSAASSATSDVVRRMVAAQEAKAAEVRRRFTEQRQQRLTTAPKDDLSAITGEPWQRYADDEDEYGRWGSLEERQWAEGAKAIMGEQQQQPQPTQLTSKPSLSRAPPMSSRAGGGGGTGGRTVVRMGSTTDAPVRMGSTDDVNSTTGRTPRQQ